MECNEVLAVREGTRTIACVSGTVWVTAKNCQRDTFLREGDRFAIEGMKKICVQALRAATIFLER
jgi:Protein of unknown function (DUF2917)